MVKKKNQETIESNKSVKDITISTKVAYQAGGVLFEINESQSFKDTDFSLDEINNMKVQLLANNLITMNNFQKQMEE
jgi:hypothetical protein